MEIRKATEKDIPAIVEVLKASLGESLVKKSSRRWNFKHIDNPFGESVVLVAVEDGDIIGVRAFMRWQWQRGEKKFSCFRAVDTATHPQHQGKGIFKKLTLEAIDIAQDGGGDFIFNTPNEKSRPGYLKMGWEEVDRLKVTAFPTNPFHWLKAGTRDVSIQKKASAQELEVLCNNWNEQKKLEQQLFTPKSPEYLGWRYENNPLQSYEVFSANGIYLAGYLKKHKYFNELRMAEIIYNDPAHKKEVKKVIEDWSRKFGATVVSASGISGDLTILKLAGKFGPVMTVRKLGLSDREYQAVSNLGNYTYSLGDLELF